MKKLGFVLLCLTLAGAAAAAEEKPAPDCTAPAHRAFDFWIGEWDAYVTGSNELAGRSTIAREDGGCVITEHWRSQRAAYTGRSLNLYDRDTGHWQQFWVDSHGDVTRFIGDAAPTGMVFTAPGDRSPDFEGEQTQRMTFTRQADGSVRQLGETSADNGATWTQSYDFTYRPHRAASNAGGGGMPARRYYRP